jgi:CRP/FNR family transcriptional regulator
MRAMAQAVPKCATNTFIRTALADEDFPSLTRLKPESRRELFTFSATRVKRRQRLLQRGDTVDGAYFIIGGSLRVYYVTAEGREATVYRVEQGGTCILAVTSSFNAEPYPAWVQAESDGAAFVLLPNPVFRRVFDSEPAFREFILAVLSRRVFELMRALEEAGSARMDQRVARYLVGRTGADGMVRASQAGIASDLGTAREVVFRALRSLSARGLVETGRVRIKVLDVQALRRVASP